MGFREKWITNLSVIALHLNLSTNNPLPIRHLTKHFKRPDMTKLKILCLHGVGTNEDVRIPIISFPNSLLSLLHCAPTAII